MEQAAVVTAPTAVTLLDQPCSADTECPDIGTDVNDHIIGADIIEPVLVDIR
ncbi:MAG: hypothetical protein MZU97_03035 [Bacillus subtilis]|nr:hypothetical protein [Bacillus subtilis]